MKTQRMKSLGILSLLVAACFAAPQAAVSQTGDAKPAFPVQYSATAFGQSGSTAGKSFGMNIYITGVTADGDRDELIGTLKAKGQDALVSRLEDTKDLGRVAPTGSVGTGMRFVRIKTKPDGSQHIVLATNRPISMGELYNATRSTQYPIGIVTLDVDKDGKGTGTFAPACKVKFNKTGDLVIENYGQKPFRLANVRREK
jgi:hypothetical protein